MHSNRYVATNDELGGHSTTSCMLVSRIDRAVRERPHFETAFRPIEAIISRNLRGTITAWNRGAQAIFGYAPQEMIGKTISLLLPAGYEDETLAILERTKRGEQIDRYETRRLCKDGSIIDVLFTVSPVLGCGGRLLGASKVAHDISAAKRVRTQLSPTYPLTSRIISFSRMPRDGACSEESATRPVTRFDANTEIYGEGDENSSFYRLVTGTVRMCKFLTDGRRQIDAFYVPGDVFGFESGARHRLSAEAVSDCTVIYYRQRTLEVLAEEDVPLARDVVSSIVGSLERAQEHVLLLGCCNARQKLAAFLLEMADRNADNQIIDLLMTRQDIADYLGLTIETVSRTFSQLEREAMIVMPRARRVQLKDRMALRDIGS